jgi:transcriptional regulator with XRE-family HTH domain
MELNKLKVVLVERKKTGKWLAEALGKNEATVSRWCANVSQPSLETLFAIAKALEVDVRELLISTKSDNL